MPIDIVYEDGFAPISPADHMVNRSRILHSRFARHGPNLPPFPSLSQPSNAQCCGVTIGRVLKGLQTGFGDDFFGRFSFNIQPSAVLAAHEVVWQGGSARNGKSCGSSCEMPVDHCRLPVWLAVPVGTKLARIRNIVAHRPPTPSCAGVPSQNCLVRRL